MASGPLVTTETVTVLFTDMVGSTALGSALAPDAADELRRRHFAILRQAVAEAGGTEVKNLGDGLMVVFKSASAALSCAVAMQQGIEHDNRGRAESVGLRVGVSAGEVSRDDDDYFGDPVVEAARLCALCEGGQVVATEIVRLTAGRRSRHVARALGALTLKGLPDPVEAVEVRWEPVGRADAEPVVPLPGRLAVGPGVRVVGRETEMAAVLDSLKRVAGGGGREVFLVSGEAGLGKTTLVAEAARAAFDGEAWVLFGHCEEDLATPYQLFSEALGHFVTHAPEGHLVTHVEAHGGELARLVPALSGRLPGIGPSGSTDADTERYQMYAAVVGLLVQMSQQQPVVLVVDDLQWADKASLQLLRHVIASDQPLRLVVLGTFRDSELSRSHPLFDTLAALHRQPAVTRIELTGLDDTEVLSLMEAAAGHTLDDAAAGLAQAVRRETDGNPFFVSEVLRHLTETGAITQDSTGRWVAADTRRPMTVPDSLRVVIGARVGRLGRDAERTLSLAAVIGRDFDLEVLARATRASEDEVLDILDAATAASLVRELVDTPGHYSFAHALIQHTLYEDLGPTRRARAHRQVADALEDLCGDRPGSRVGELARHFGATRPLDGAKALNYSRQAADAALDALAPADALRHYAQALDLYAQTGSTDPVLGVDLAVGLGTAQRQTGDSTFRDTLLGAARLAADLGDTGRLVAAALANNRGIATAAGTVDADKVEILEKVLDRLTPADPERALVAATLCAELVFGRDFERCQALANEAVAIAETSGDDAVIVRVLNGVSFALRVPPLFGQVLAQSADAMRRAEIVGDPVLRFWAAHNRSGTAAWAEDIDEMDRCLEIAGSLAQQLDQPNLHWIHRFNRALRAQIAGDAEETERLATEALQLGTDSGQPDAELIYDAQLMAVSFQRGTYGETDPAGIEQAAQDFPAFAGVLVSSSAAVHLEAGRLDHARRLLEEFAATDFDLPLNPSWTTGMVNYADVAIACRSPEHARPLFDRLAPWADQMATSGADADGPISHYVGGLATVLGRYDEAEAYFAHAAAFSERAGAMFFGARTNLLWGKMLAERQAPGDDERARDLLTKAQAAAAAGGYANVERRATEALERLN